MSKFKRFISGLIACSMFIGSFTSSVTSDVGAVTVSHELNSPSSNIKTSRASVTTYSNTNARETTNTTGKVYLVDPVKVDGSTFTVAAGGVVMPNANAKTVVTDANGKAESDGQGIALGDGWNLKVEGSNAVQFIPTDDSGNFGLNITVDYDRARDELSLKSKWNTEKRSDNLYGRAYFGSSTLPSIGHAVGNINDPVPSNAFGVTSTGPSDNPTALYNSYKRVLQPMAEGTLRITMRIPDTVQQMIKSGKDVYILPSAYAWAAQDGSRVGRGRVLVDTEKWLITIDYRPNAAYGLLGSEITDSNMQSHIYYTDFPSNPVTINQYMNRTESWGGGSNNLPFSSTWLDTHSSRYGDGKYESGRVALSTYNKLSNVSLKSYASNYGNYQGIKWQIKEGIASNTVVTDSENLPKGIFPRVNLGGYGLDLTNSHGLMYDKSTGVNYHVESGIYIKYYSADPVPSGAVVIKEPADLSQYSINKTFKNQTNITVAAKALPADVIEYFNNSPTFGRTVDVGLDSSSNNKFKRPLDEITVKQTIPTLDKAQVVEAKGEDKAVPKYGLYGFSAHTTEVNTLNKYKELVKGPNRVLIKPSKDLQVYIKPLNSALDKKFTADNDPIVILQNSYGGGNLEDLVALFSNCSDTPDAKVELRYKLSEYMMMNGTPVSGTATNKFELYNPLPAGVTFNDTVSISNGGILHDILISGRGADVAKMIKVLPTGKVGTDIRLKSSNFRDVPIQTKNQVWYDLKVLQDTAKTTLYYPVDAQGASPAGTIVAPIVANIKDFAQTYMYNQGSTSLKLTGSVTVAAENGYELNEYKNLASKNSNVSEKGTTTYANIKLATVTADALKIIQDKMNSGYTSAVLTGTTSWDNSAISKYTLGNGSLTVTGNTFTGTMPTASIISLIDSTAASNISGTTTKFKNVSLSPNANPAQDTLQSLNTGVLTWTNVKLTLKGNGLNDFVIDVAPGNFGSGTWTNTIKAQPMDSFKAHIVKNRSDIVPAKPDGSKVRIAAEIPWNLTETSEGLKQGKHYEYPKNPVIGDTTIPAERWQMKLNITRTATSNMGNGTLGEAKFNIPGWIFPNVVLNSGAFGYSPATVLKELVNSLSVYQTIFDESSRDFIIKPGEVITLTYSLSGEIILPDVDNVGKTKTIPIQSAICKNTFTGVSEETFTYKSEPNEYAEIKQGTPGNETFEAMAGVPSTEVLHLSAGGSEFVVAVQTQYVQQVTTERKYTATWKSRNEDEGTDNKKDNLDRSAFNARFKAITEPGTGIKLDFHTGTGIAKTLISGNTTDVSVNNTTTSDEDNKSKYMSNPNFLGKETGFKWRRQDDYRDNTANGQSASGNNYVELNNSSADPKEQLLPFHRPYIWKYETNESVDKQKGSIWVVEDADINTIETKVCEGKYFWTAPPRGKGAITQGTQTSSTSRANSSSWYPKDSNGYESISSLIPGTAGNNAPANQADRELLGWQWPGGPFIHDEDATYNVDGYETPSDTSLWIKQSSNLGYDEPEEHLEPLVDEAPSGYQYDIWCANFPDDIKLGGPYNPWEDRSNEETWSKWEAVEKSFPCKGKTSSGSDGPWCQHQDEPEQPIAIHSPHSYNDGVDSEGKPIIKQCPGGEVAAKKVTEKKEGKHLDNETLVVSSIQTYTETQKAQWYQARSAQMERTWNWFRPALPAHFACNWGYPLKYNSITVDLPTARTFSKGSNVGTKMFTDSSTTMSANFYSSSEGRPYDNIISKTSNGNKYYTFDTHNGNPLTNSEKVKDYLGNLEMQCSAIADGFTDTWVQRETYDYMKINSIKVYKIDSANIEKDANGEWINSILKGKPTDTIKANIVQGDPTLYANIAKANTSLDGRKVHSLYTNLHDDVIIPSSDLSNNGIVDNSHANLYPAGLELGHKTERNWVNTVLKPKLNTTTIVSDFAILQTTGGDQVVLYFEKDMPTMETGRKYNNVGTELIQSSSPSIMWYNNPSAIVTWDAQEGINVGGYNGRFMDVKNKLSKAGNKSFRTIFQGKGAVNEGGLSKFGSFRTGIRTPIRIEKLNLEIEPTTTNGEKSTGIVKNTYRVDNDARALYNYAGNVTYGEDTVDVEDRKDFSWAAGTGFKEAVYGDTGTSFTGKVNDLVIHTPVSTQFTLVQSLPKELDQRTAQSIENSVNNALQDVITVTVPGTIPEEGYTWKWPNGNSVSQGSPSETNKYGHDNDTATISYWVTPGKNQTPSEAPVQYKRRFIFPDTGLPIPVGYVGSNGQVYNKVEWFPYEGTPAIPCLDVRQWEYTLTQDGIEHSKGFIGNQFTGAPPNPSPQTLVGDALTVVAGQSYNGKTYKWSYEDGVDRDGGIIFEGIDDENNPGQQWESRLEWRWSDGANPKLASWFDGATETAKPVNRYLSNQISLAGWNFNYSLDGWKYDSSKVSIVIGQNVLYLDVIGSNPSIYRNDLNIPMSNVDNFVISMWSDVKYLPKNTTDTNKGNNATLTLETLRYGAKVKTNIDFQLAWGDNGYVNYVIPREKFADLNETLVGMYITFPNTMNERYIVDFIDITSNSSLNDLGNGLYGYTGKIQTFVAPEDGTYNIEAWGASGGGNTPHSGLGSEGGAGGYTSGKVTLKQGEKLLLYVGGEGKYSNGFGVGGGWNGGGAGGPGGYGGGGASDIRKDGASLSNRILIAGGGGGSDNKATDIVGGQDDGSGGHGGGWPSSTNALIDGVYKDGMGASYEYGYALGIGQDVSVATDSGGGGGGYYGGKTTNHGNGGGGGGTGWWNSSIVSDGKSLRGDQTIPSYTGNLNTFGNVGNGAIRITKDNGINEDNSISIGKIFKFTGSLQTYTAPETGTYLLQAWGASGGEGNTPGGKMEGLGGYASGKVTLTKGQQIEVYVGEDGIDTRAGEPFNGGGLAFRGGDSAHWGGRGGGATDFRLPGGSLTGVSTAIWNFNNTLDGFVSGTSTLTYNSTCLISTVSTSDSYFFSPAISGISTSDVSKIEIRLQNNTSATENQIYYTTSNSSGFDETKVLRFNTNPNTSGFEVYTIDMTTSANWTGDLTRLRFDLSNGVTSGSVGIDYIKLIGKNNDTRLLVAGGGGGYGCASSHNPGHGGGLTGVTTLNPSGTYSGASASGGSQTAGGTGIGLFSAHGSNSGSLGKGADGAQCAAGGGGGYYGGGSEYTAGGGGGSSYIGGVTNGVTKSGGTSMPDIDGSTINGNNGNGKAKITLISSDTKESAYSGLKTYTAPYDGDYIVETWGSQGSNYEDKSGGNGAYVKGTVTLKKGETLTFSLGNTDGVGGGGLGSANGGGATHAFIGSYNNNYDMSKFNLRAGSEYLGSSVYCDNTGEGIYGPYVAIPAGTYIVQVFGSNLTIGDPIPYYNYGNNALTVNRLRKTNTYAEYYVSTNIDIPNMEWCWHQTSAGEMSINLVTVASWNNRISTAGGGGGASINSKGIYASASTITGTGNYAGGDGNKYIVNASPAIGVWYHNTSGCTYYGEMHNTTSQEECTDCGHSCGYLSSWTDEVVAQNSTSGGGGGGVNGGEAGIAYQFGIHGGKGGGSITYSMKNVEIIGGDSLMPSPFGGNETGHSGNGMYRVTPTNTGEFVNGAKSLLLKPIKTLQGTKWMDPFKKYVGNWQINTAIKELKNSEALVEIDKTRKYTAVETKVGLNGIAPNLIMGVPNKVIEVPNNMGAYDSINKVLVDGASFLVLDAPFKIYYPNIGDFQGNNALGIGDLTVMRGLGYVDNMDTTKWTREKWITLDYDVISRRVCDVDVDFKVGDNTVKKRLPMTFELGKEPSATYERLFKAGEPIPVDINSVWLDFYIPLEQDEKASANTEFNSVAINSPQILNKEGDVPRNLERYEKLAAKHNAIKNQKIDLIGRIGNLALTDTGDPRWSSFFKQAGTDWLVPNLIPNVDTSTQKNYLADIVDIRGNLATTATNMLNTWGGIPYLSKSPMRFPLTPDKNNISIFRENGVALGYNWIGEISTLGNYDKTEITPIFYYIDTTSEANTPIPVDIYSFENGKYLPLNFFNRSNSAGVDKGTLPLTTEVDIMAQAGRRNISSVEINKTIDAFTRRIQTSATRIKPFNSSKTYIGNSQLLSLDGRTTTYIGSSETYGVNKNPQNNVDEIDYTANAQRWHYSVGLPTSATIVPTGEKPSPTTALSSKNGYLIVALKIMSAGEVWNVSYFRPEYASVREGDTIRISENPVPLTIHGKTFDIRSIPLNYAILGVYDTVRTAKQEFSTSGDR